MAINISVKTMAARTKSRFGAAMLFSILTFAAALAAIWILHERPVSDEWIGTPPLENDPIAMTIFEAALSGLCFCVAGTLLAEALQRIRLRTGLAIAGFVMGAGLYCLCGGLTQREDILAGLAVSAVLVCCALIASGNRPRVSLQQAFACVYICGFVLTLVLMILYLLRSAVTELFVPDISWQVTDQLDSTSLAISTLLVAPFLVFSYLPDQDTPQEKYSGVRKVLSYVILPAYLLLLAVLLGYIATIIFKWEFPVGQMNPYAMLALGTFAGLHLLLTGEENKLSRLFVRYGAWALLPVIVVQAIAVYIRVDAYGLTQSRIIGLAFTAACLIPVLSAFLRRYGRSFFIVGAVLSFVLMATPLNAPTLACLNQESRLFGALAQAHMLDETGRIIPNENAAQREREIIWSSAEYLDSYSSDLPENSRAADFIRQLNAVNANELQQDYDYLSRFKVLFGFDDPNQTLIGRTQHAVGASSSEEVDVEGFRHARLLYLTLNADSGWCADADGDTIHIDTLLSLADFESGVLTESDILLPSGRTLRINSLDFKERYAEGGYDPDYCLLSAWLLTP